MTSSIHVDSWTGILLAFVAYFILGALWFTTILKKAYLRSLGKEDAGQKPSPIFIVGPALCTLVITISSAILMNALAIDSYRDATMFSMIIGIGYLFANTVNIAINPNIPRPILYGMISGTYHLVGIFVCCLILYTFR